MVDATVPLVPPKVMRVQLPPGGSAGKSAQVLLGERVRVVRNMVSNRGGMATELRDSVLFALDVALQVKAGDKANGDAIAELVKVLTEAADTPVSAM